MRDRKYYIYKPTKAGKGSAAQFDLVIDEERKLYCIFLEMANQDHEAFKSDPTLKTMDWSKKIRVKLGSSDISKMIYGIAKGQEVKLFHKTKSSDTMIGIVPSKNGSYLNVSKRSENGSPERVSLPLAPDELNTLKILFSQALVRFYDW